MGNKEFSNRVKGAVNKVKGETKDQVGNATDNPKLLAEGKYDKIKGAVQEKISGAKERLADKIK